MAKSDIKVRLLGENKTGAAFNKFKKDVEGTQSSLKNLRNTLITAFSVREITQAADQFVNIQNRMGALTGSVEGTAKAMSEMKRIAIESRTDFDAIGTLFTRLTIATQELGVSQDDIAKATQTVANTFVIAGAESSEAANSARQLAQGLASGALRGDELRSVMENNVILSNLLSKGLGITTGELKQFGSEGKLTAEAILPILINAVSETSETVDNMSITLGQAFTNLRTQFTTLVGQINNATGAFSMIASAVNIISQNLDALFIPALVAVMAIIPKLITGLKTLIGLAMANPFTLILVGLTALATAMYIFRDQLNDLFQEFIQKTLPTAVEKTKIFFNEAFLAFQEKFVMPIKQGFTNFINFILGKVNVGIANINKLIDKLPKRIKDKLGVSNIPPIDLLPDVSSEKVTELKEKIAGYYAEVEDIAKKEIDKSNLPTITQYLFGENAGAEGGEDAGKTTKKITDSIKTSVEDTTQVVKQFADTIDGKLTSAFQDFFDSTSKGFLDFKNLVTNVANAVIKELINIYIVQKLVGMVKSVISPEKEVTAEANNALGGFVKKGHTYLVGESGRELFTPSVNGNITSNQDLERKNNTQTSPVINLNISANDSAGFDDLLVKRKNLLVSIISQAMNQKGNAGLA
jgi:tape measure domain-containing protein